MNLERVQGTPMLCITPDIRIVFRDSWINQLRSLPYDQYGEYIRSNIYPALSDDDRKLWNKSTISNKDLQTAIQTFK